MADLPTNLKDDILDSSVNTRRKYNMIENPDGTVEFEDVTEYRQVGDEYGAGLINETNKQVNARVEKAVVVRDLETIGAITQEGFIPDALALKDVNDSLQSLLTTQAFTQSVTLGASPEAKDFEIDVSLDGYTPIGVIGSKAGNRYLVLYRQYIENNMFYGTLKNTNSSSITTDAEVCILYRKNM